MHKFEVNLELCIL